jgi:hypothetical protein
MSLSGHVHHFALVISIYDLVIFIDGLQGALEGVGGHVGGPLDSLQSQDKESWCVIGQMSHREPGVVIRTGNPRVLLGNPYPTHTKPLPALTGTGFGGFG